MSSIREGLPTPASKMALKVLQFNISHCEAAQDGNLDGLSWKTDAANSAAIWACSKNPVQEVMKNPEEAFVRVKISGIYFYSCYKPTSMPHEDLIIRRISKFPVNYTTNK